MSGHDQDWYRSDAGAGAGAVDVGELLGLDPFDEAHDHFQNFSLHGQPVRLSGHMGAAFPHPTLRQQMRGSVHGAPSADVPLLPTPLTRLNTMKRRKKNRASAFAFAGEGGEHQLGQGIGSTSSAKGPMLPRELDHIPSNPLSPTIRVGFSIQNLTGQPVRYLQQWDGGRRTVQYLNHNERGLLNFVASKTLIRNGQVVEETFNVQMERNAEDSRSRNRRKAVGNRVALQVAGYRWLHAVQADELGVRYEDLFSVLGRVQASVKYKDWKVANALKLMVEVTPFCGGRMLRLRSVFTIKNNTRHPLKILAREGSLRDTASEEDQEKAAPFHLESGESFHVPLALLRRSVLASSGRSLGSLYLRPASLAPIEEELVSRPNVLPGSVEYTMDPINLIHTLERSSEAAAAAASYHGPAASTRPDGAARPSIVRDPSESIFGSSATASHAPHSGMNKEPSMQLVCIVNPKVKSRFGQGRRQGGAHGESHGAEAGGSGGGSGGTGDDKGEKRRRAGSGAHGILSKLPPFCYCVEVQRNTGAVSSSEALHKMTQPGKPGRFFTSSRDVKVLTNPANFTISKSNYFIYAPAMLKLFAWLTCILFLQPPTHPPTYDLSSWIACSNSSPHCAGKLAAL